MQPSKKVTIESTEAAQGVLVHFASRQAADACQFREIFRSVVESSPDAILVTDPGFRVLLGNERGLSILKSGEVTGRSVFEFLSREHAAPLRSAARRAQET